MIALSWIAVSLMLGLVPLRGRIPEDGPMRIPALILAIVICVLGVGSLLIGVSRSVSRHFGLDEEPDPHGRIRQRRRVRRR